MPTLSRPWTGLSQRSSAATERSSEMMSASRNAERAGRPMTHDELIAIVWGSGDLPGGREMLKTSIWRLRLRLTQVNPVTVIESVRGTGYMMVKLSG